MHTNPHTCRTLKVAIYAQDRPHTSYALDAWCIPIFKSVSIFVWSDCSTRHIHQCHRVCLGLGGPLIYNLSVALRHVPIVALISWLIVWNGALPTLTTQCYDCHASTPRVELSPLFCLSQWGQLLSTVVWTTVEWGRCKWIHPAHYSRQKKCETFLNKARLCPLLSNSAESWCRWNAANSSSLLVFSVSGYNGRGLACECRLCCPNAQLIGEKL